MNNTHQLDGRKRKYPYEQDWILLSLSNLEQIFDRAEYVGIFIDIA